MADGIIYFFDRCEELHTNGIAFEQDTALNKVAYKVFTDFSLLGIDRSDSEAFAISEVKI